MSDMLERAARAAVNERAKWTAEGEALDQCEALPGWDETAEVCRDDARREARAALLAALEDEALVEAIAKRLAEDATAARNAIRMIRQNIDLTNAPPVSASIFKKDARLMLETLKSIAQGERPVGEDQGRKD